MNLVFLLELKITLHKHLQVLVLMEV